MDSKRLTRVTTLLAAAAAGLGAACDGNTEPQPIVAAAIEVAFVPRDTIAISQTTFATARVLDREGQEIDATVTWTSSNSGVAKVHENGGVVGIVVGEAYIRASFQNVRDSAKVVVVGLAAR